MTMREELNLRVKNIEKAKKKLLNLAPFRQAAHNINNPEPTIGGSTSKGVYRSEVIKLATTEGGYSVNPQRVERLVESSSSLVWQQMRLAAERFMVQVLAPATWAGGSFYFGDSVRRGIELVETEGESGRGDAVVLVCMIALYALSYWRGMRLSRRLSDPIQVAQVVSGFERGEMRDRMVQAARGSVSDFREVFREGFESLKISSIRRGIIHTITLGIGIPTSLAVTGAATDPIASTTAIGSAFYSSVVNLDPAIFWRLYTGLVSTGGEKVADALERLWMLAASTAT